MSAPPLDPQLARRALHLLADKLDVQHVLRALPELSEAELQQILRKAASGAARWKATPAFATAAAASDALPKTQSGARKGAEASAEIRDAKPTASSPIDTLQMYTLYCDGASRGNPGPAGSGAVIFDAYDTVVHEVSRYLGRATNNVAEYQALLDGLTAALDLGIKYITVNSDSELLCNQMNGIYRVRNRKLLPLYQAARQAADKFDIFLIRHVYREMNSHADRLANQGIDRR